MANIDFGKTNFSHSLNIAGRFDVRNVLNNISEVDQHYRFTENKALKDNGYVNLTMKDSDGILLNLDEVLQNPTVNAEIKKRIKFYNDMSLRLQALKHEYASLYFINADI
jgi:hypothetical protein